ncbi:hypothetical protein ILUMI_23557 [Ignelater luminosus]|uniref:Uncharacterized protein n=1 Tax=Ignelater luminosus TaxID=2038154 RepID=A0A8K0CC78_IGNLU|nr:hypothetical protein ILUMI_23557 [Ignelater luminosus]
MKLGSSGTRYAVSEKTLAASFEISKLIAKANKTPTISESLIKPCMLKAAKNLLGQEAQKKIREIPLSNDTLSRLQGSGNMKLEGTSNIFAFEDKISAFIAKIDLWISKVERENFSAFDTSNPIIDGQCAEIKGEIQTNITLHLQNLKNEFNRYFPDCKDKGIRKLIRNPFIVNISEVPDEIQEELIQMQRDSNCKDTFDTGIKLEDF